MQVSRGAGKETTSSRHPETSPHSRFPALSVTKRGREGPRSRLPRLNSGLGKWIFERRALRRKHLAAARRHDPVVL
jgi:hypothetical protein